MNALIVLIFLLPLGLAGSLIFRGLRGIRVGDHPICRKCGFDLYGKPESTNHCGECGADLNRRGAIRIGYRQRRPVLLSIGTLMLMIMISGAGVSGYRIARHGNWWHYAPLWYVIRRVSSSDSAAQSAAMNELESRCKCNQLRKGQLAEVLNLAFARQADLSSAWDSRWGDIIEDADDLGQLSSERWRTYARQAIAENPTLWVQSRARLDGALEWRMVVPAARIAASSNLFVYTSWSFDHPDYNPGVGNAGGWGTWQTSAARRANRSIPEPVTSNSGFLPGMPLGPHKIRVTVTREVSDITSPANQTLVTGVKSVYADYEIVSGNTTQPVNWNLGTAP